MKRKYLWITLVLCGVALVVFIISQNRVIGEVRGPEWDQIVIDDVVYYRENNNDFSRNDSSASCYRSHNNIHNKRYTV